MKLKFLFVIGFLIMSTSNAQLFKVSDQGSILTSTSLEHRCILDDQSKLVWEVKLNTKGLQNTQNTYTWFDGKIGVENGDYSHNCHWAKSCNTQAYVKAVNDVKLCKQANWRLPTEVELRALLVYGDNDLLINQKFFINTQLKSYWSSDQQSADIAIDVPFFYGGSKSADKSFDAYVRLVSDAN
ncbi:Glutamate synthase [NADPH] large chain [uncultured Candidatus Thioglobus sp.]|nr:Glutamate synthase [NADPH] large chain [uncultured Candidatus Thioglobus sp.]